MIEKPFIEKFPKPLPRDPESLFRKWVDAHQDEFNRRDEVIDEVVSTRRILDAEGDDLDRIGDRFGRLGRRRGRGDEQYRSFLLSILPSFQGRGTPTGLAFAIGAGVQASGDEIEIEEHFDELEYSVTIGDWIAHEVTTVHELAELADPSGVQLRHPVTYAYDRGGVGISASRVDAGTVVTAPPVGVGIATHDTTVSIRGGGFGAGEFDGDDDFGEYSPHNPDREDSLGTASFGQSSFGGS